MAVLIRAGFFCTGGHTELGAKFVAPDERELAAIDAFLRKINPEIEWSRAFPAHRKPGPKPGVRTSFRDSADGGVTGTKLVDEMRERLRKHYRGAACDIDVVVLIDDADCRFLREGAPALSTWAREMEQEVRAWTERSDLRFVPLLASPEIEAWLLADWDEGFGKEYASIAVHLGRALQAPTLLGCRPWDRIELFGGPYDVQKQSCTQKLSTEVQTVLEQLAKPAMEQSGAIDPRTYTYSKRENGPDMLRRVRPDRIMEVCRQLFLPAMIELHALASRPAGTPSAEGSEVPASS